MTAAVIPSRRVRRLSLRAPTAELAQHSAVLLGDALHVATIPGADQGKVVVIRRLALGRIEPCASSASLSLAIEEATRSLALQAVPADSPAAPTADVVVFRDCIQALVLLARRVASRQSAHEWFWKAVFPDWKPGSSRPVLWQSLLEVAHHQTAPAAAVTGVMQEAIKTGTTREMVADVSIANVRVWLWLLNLDPSAPPSQMESISRELFAANALMPRTIESCLSEWGFDDLRSFWLTAMSMLIVQPSLATAPDFPARVRGWLVQKEHTRAIGPLLRTGHKQSEVAEQNVGTGRPVGTRVSAPGSTDEELLASNASEPALTQGGANRQYAEPESPFLSAIPVAGERTAFAGLLFLVPVLMRLGIREFLQQNPAVSGINFPESLLLHIGQRVGLSGLDPLALALAGEGANTFVGAALHDRRLPLEVRGSQNAATTNCKLGLGYPARLLCLLESPKPRCAIDSPLDAWLVAVRRWVRREIRMGLLALICRRGRVLVSRSHLEIGFALDQADVRLRRQGLDVNPGWVPWLGRVVQFHYDDCDAY